MPWVRLDDHFDENPKIASVGPLGLALWVTGLAYCNRNLTDGFIPSSVALRLLSLEFDYMGEPSTVLVGGQRDYNEDTQVGTFPDGHYLPRLLVGAHLWDSVAGGYQIHDFEQYQPTKAQVESDRAQKQAAGQAGGKASAQARAQAKSKQGPSDIPTIPQAKSNPVPDPVPPGSKEPESATRPLPLPRKTTPTEEWLAEMREHYGPLLRDFDETLGFHMNGSYYRGCRDKCGFLEKKLKAAVEREGGIGVNGKAKSLDDPFAAMVVKGYDQ